MAREWGLGSTTRFLAQRLRTTRLSDLRTVYDALVPTITVGTPDYPDDERPLWHLATTCFPRVNQFPTVSFGSAVRDVAIFGWQLYVTFWNYNTGGRLILGPTLYQAEFLVGTPPDSYNPLQNTPVDPATGPPWSTYAGYPAVGAGIRPRFSFDTGNAAGLLSSTTTLNPFIGWTAPIRPQIDSALQGGASPGSQPDLVVHQLPRPLILPVDMTLVFQTNLAQGSSLNQTALNVSVWYSELDTP